ncbi:cysteine protease-like [Solanum pennellii]|uniref:Cysteine protease-like n=1 Tax=Solanum pennellii TaxID=28526 RepID=A0ABM1UVK9_SOLPN|nr:cysteine protease-like [Solanum pennellii]
MTGLGGTLSSGWVIDLGLRRWAYWIGFESIVIGCASGCCWAFACTGSITALDAIIRKREVIPLSKQQLLDCMFKHYPMPELEAKLERRECFGLSRRMAYIFAKEQGIVEESKYHYIMERSKCKCPRDANIVKIDGHKEIDMEKTSNKEIYMGPTEEETRIATSGDENKKAVLHALIIVGYGEVNGEAFYLVQNSWGYKGFAKIKQSLAMNLSYPFIDEEKKE